MSRLADDFSQKQLGNSHICRCGKQFLAHSDKCPYCRSLDLRLISREHILSQDSDIDIIEEQEFSNPEDIMNAIFEVTGYKDAETEKSEVSKKDS